MIVWSHYSFTVHIEAPNKDLNTTDFVDFFSATITLILIAKNQPVINSHTLKIVGYAPHAS